MNFAAIEKINQPNTKYEVEKKELDLTKIEDLDLLVTNAEDLYKDILSYELVAENDNFKSFTTNKKVGREIFLDAGLSLEDLKLQALELKTEITNESFNITDTQVDTIQSLYNYLISIRDDSKNAYSDIDDVEFISQTDEAEEGNDDEVADTYFFSAVSKEDDQVPVNINKRGDIFIRNESNDGDIKIEVKVANNASEAIANELNQTEESPAKIIVPEEMSQDEQGALTEIEEIDPINEAVVEPASTVSEESKNYIIDNSFREVAAKNKLEPESFNRYLEGLVKRIEDDSLDFFDSYFGEFDSAFGYIKDMSLVEFQNLLNENDLRNKIRNENIKYETFLVWADLFDREKYFLLEQGEDESEITFEEFFGRWAIENNK